MSAISHQLFSLQQEVAQLRSRAKRAEKRSEWGEVALNIAVQALSLVGFIYLLNHVSMSDWAKILLGFGWIVWIPFISAFLRYFTVSKTIKAYANNGGIEAEAISEKIVNQALTYLSSKYNVSFTDDTFYELLSQSRLCSDVEVIKEGKKRTARISWDDQKDLILLANDVELTTV